MPILVGEVKQEINPRNERPMTVAIEDSYKPELMQDYAYFAPTRTVPMARVYVLPDGPAFQPVVDKVRQHGIVVEELTSPLTTEVSSFVVEAIDKSPKPFQGHNEVKLKGRYASEKVTLPAGTRVVQARAAAGPARRLPAGAGKRRWADELELPRSVARGRQAGARPEDHEQRQDIMLILVGFGDWGSADCTSPNQ